MSSTSPPVSTSYTYPDTNPPKPCSYVPILYTPRLTLTIADPTNPFHLSVTLSCLNDPLAVSRMGDFHVRTHAHLTALNTSTQLLPSHTPLKIPLSGPAYYIIHLGPDNSHGEAIGIVSLASRDEMIPPDMGWLLLSPYHGHGYATEACRRFLRYFLDEFQGCGFRGAETKIGVIAWPLPDNVSSVNVARKLGMVEMGEVSAEGESEGTGGNVVYGVPGLGINGGRRYTRDTRVEFYGVGDAGRKTRVMLLGEKRLDE